MKLGIYFDVNPTGNTHDFGDYITYIDTSSVKNGELLEVQLLEKEYPSRAKRKILGNDILYSSVRPILRHYYYYTDTYEHAVASTGFFLIRSKHANNKYRSKFVYYYLSTNSIVEYLNNIAESSQTTFPSCSDRDVLKITLPDFSLKHQDMIITILSQYDNLISINKKRIKLLEETAQQLYQEWFVRFRFPGYETTKFVDGIPQGWEKCKLKDMIAFNPVYRIKKGSVYTKIPMEALPTDGLSIDTDAITAEDSSSGTHFMNGDVLCAKITPCLENGKTGLVACLQEDEVGVGSTEFIVMHGERVDSFLVYCIARDERFRQQAINSMNGADGRQRADISFIQNRPWILPNKQILRQFKVLTDKMVATVLRLEQQNKNLTKQRDLLLPRLMSGKLAV